MDDFETLTLDEFLAARAEREPGVRGVLDHSTAIEDVAFDYDSWVRIERNMLATTTSVRRLH